MITYTTNNSGGGWWLDDEDWKALESAGWKVDWVADNPRHQFYREGQTRFLGALATSATREGLDLDEAIEEWERVTGQSADDEGCSCCGEPHYFHEAPLVGELIDGKELE
ncbi:hypothetical protein SEA_BAILEYBLU_53 [Arthrobacter phage BaileyBlu]|uniref:Uncharacterized protein n=1 Tax=Arthrobacter phage BaileyBlu TaxID=2910754 RepID=A0AA49BPB4_9CAUD|nr:hypothetical protein PQD78_gp53 [Arthrobacter phage BaileyBlu]UJQ87191.1 hypothetical protein SEA_BAILEYBLU_53 [Arthrobacter phage BaileyBlu]